MKLLQLLRCRFNIINYIALTLVAAIITGVSYYIFLLSTKYLSYSSAGQNPGSNDPATTSKLNLILNHEMVTVSQDLVEDLVGVMHALKTAQNNQLPPSNNSLKTLQRILKEINPEPILDKILNENKNLNNTQPVCQDVYTNRTLGLPYYNKGWITQPCDAPPIEEVVSIVLNPLDDNWFQHLDWILNGVHKTYPTVSLYIATVPEHEAVSAKRYPNVHRVSVSNTDSSGNIWMKLISKVTTPYVLVARNLFHFSNFTRLERQISIVNSSKLIPVAGGATRNFTGHWSAGCFQTQISNYVLKYIEGYHVSRNECMFCNYIAGPFIARTDIFKEISLNPSLPEEMLFHDFFLELRKERYLVANCPDAMYFSNSHRATSFNKDSWIPLARKWQLNRILQPNGVKHVITCKESHLSCNRSITTAYLIPLCCREQYVRFLTKVVEPGYPYEFRAGDALAAVKMHGSIPWDIDIDLSGRLIDKDLWKNANYDLKPEEFELLDFGDWLSFEVTDTHINMDLYNDVSCNVLLPKELKNLPTRVEYDGEWLIGPASPGLYARNGYGEEMLRHTQSYKYHGYSDEFALYYAGSFLPCPDPNHHACLNHYSPDGNIQFLAP